jgi:hypothetical protein
MWLGDRKCGREHECESGMVTVGLALPFDDEAAGERSGMYLGNP